MTRPSLLPVAVCAAVAVALLTSACSRRPLGGEAPAPTLSPSSPVEVTQTDPPLTPGRGSPCIERLGFPQPPDDFGFEHGGDEERAPFYEDEPGECTVVSYEPHERDVGLLVQFYTNELRRLGWTLREDVDDSGSSTVERDLLFSKGTVKLAVWISYHSYDDPPSDGSAQEFTRLHIFFSNR